MWRTTKAPQTEEIHIENSARTVIDSRYRYMVSMTLALFNVTGHQPEVAPAIWVIVNEGAVARAFEPSVTFHGCIALPQCCIVGKNICKFNC